MNILEFILQIRKYDDSGSIGELFTKGFCYYFAVILQERFGGEIVYEPIEGHFYCAIGNAYYDYYGKWELEGKTLWHKAEWLSRKSIVDGCILKERE